MKRLAPIFVLSIVLLGAGCVSLDTEEGIVKDRPAQDEPVGMNTDTATQVPRTEGFQVFGSYVFDDKAYATGSWVVRMSPGLAFKDDVVRIVLHANDPSVWDGGGVIQGTLVQITQNPATPGLGKTETVDFLDDGSGGDERAGDGHFSAEVSARDWYGLVALVDIQAMLHDGTVIRKDSNLRGVTFGVFDLTSQDASVFVSDHAIAVMPSSYGNAAQVFAEGVDRCYPHLEEVMGFAPAFRNGKAIYQGRVGGGYLETGGYINTVRATDSFFRDINPDGMEWRECNPITAHELTHSVLADTPHPKWVAEGLAEFTSREVSGAVYECTKEGWRDATSDSVHAYVKLGSAVDWKNEIGNYMTSLCVFRMIKEEFGDGAIKSIYATLRDYAGHDHDTYCSASYDFYRDVLAPATSDDFMTGLHSLFGISDEAISCKAL